MTPDELELLGPPCPWCGLEEAIHDSSLSGALCALHIASLRVTASVIRSLPLRARPTARKIVRPRATRSTA